jgi:hypothetical protein
MHRRRRRRAISLTRNSCAGSLALLAASVLPTPSPYSTGGGIMM